MRWERIAGRTRTYVPLQRAPSVIISRVSNRDADRPSSVAWLWNTPAGWLIVGFLAGVVCIVLGAKGVWGDFGLDVGCAWLALVAWNAFKLWRERRAP
jgi:hypothetical protein